MGSSYWCGLYWSWRERAGHGKENEVGEFGQHKGSWGNRIWEVMQLGCQGGHSPVLRWCGLYLRQCSLPELGGRAGLGEDGGGIARVVEWVLGNRIQGMGQSSWQEGHSPAPRIGVACTLFSCLVCVFISLKESVIFVKTIFPDLTIWLSFVEFFCVYVQEKFGL